ncbi:MAG: plsX, partial [Oscillospiraceae bacterium]|nr:plsX [Oscillospiraceae bacterium]
MKIIVDGFGGDNAPLAVLQGCEMAVKQHGVDIIVTGDESIIKEVADKNNISLHNIDIVHAPTVIDVEENPVRILKEKNDCSMAVAFKLLAEGKGDAFVGAGSTGAIVVGASYIVKRIKGIKRAALAPIIPSDKGCYMLMDGGANLDCKPEMLMQFGIMGSVYMNKIIKVKNPRVGLVNIGEEETKGNDLQIEAYKLLKQAPVNF